MQERSIRIKISKNFNFLNFGENAFSILPVIYDLFKKEIEWLNYQGYYYRVLFDINVTPMLKKEEIDFNFDNNYVNFYFKFKNEEQAVHYKLVWGGD